MKRIFVEFSRWRDLFRKTTHTMGYVAEVCGKDEAKDAVESGEKR